MSLSDPTGRISGTFKKIDKEISEFIADKLFPFVSSIYSDKHNSPISRLIIKKFVLTYRQGKNIKFLVITLVIDCSDKELDKYVAYK